jgi:hypothetical protein
VHEHISSGDCVCPFARFRDVTREDTAAVIEHADTAVSTTHPTIGESITNMTDSDILDVYNSVIDAQIQSLLDWDNTKTEIPPGKPQIKSAVLLASGVTRRGPALRHRRPGRRSNRHPD